MIQPVTIPKDWPQDSALSYEFLRSEGIKYIQQLAGNSWTDHNIHDPGITLLELLCFAITDLSYRIDNDVKELLGRNNASSYTGLYSPATILTTNPVTLNDMRKLVIDVKGVKNAWIEKVARIDENEAGQSYQLKGLYRLVFEKEEAYGSNVNVPGEVRRRLQACRNVCEDFEAVTLLSEQFICLHGTIEVGQVEDMVQLAANVLLRAATCISPRIPFYTLSQLLDKGKRIDELFDGPALNRGFILDEDLQNSQRRSELHTSDLIRAIMDETNVLAVNEFSLSTGTGSANDWVLPLDATKTPRLQVRQSLDSLQFVKKGLQTAVDKDKVEQLYISMRDALQYKELPLYERDIVMDETGDSNLANYHSIQYQLPANYALGLHALPDSASDNRKAQASQLKGYLLFFEQLLANYFSQIAHFKDLVGYEGEGSTTWFVQSLLDSVPGVEAILESSTSYEAYLQEAVTTGNATSGLARKNNFLNHLLARFGESFTDYAMLLYDPAIAAGNDPAQWLIRDKSAFLQQYPAVSNNRARACNSTGAYWDTDNVSGLEKRIALKLGIQDDTRRNLADVNTEGFYMVEHILLRPGLISTTQDTEALKTLLFTNSFIADPYSLQVTFVLPNWAGRFQNGNFKLFTERVIREETPVHITTYIQWLSKEEMQRFDGLYRSYLSLLSQ